MSDELARALEDAREWRCFHCDEVFTSHADALAHFGGSELEEPGCKLNALEGGILALYRDAQQELQRYRSEDHEAHRTFYALGADHYQALRREEEKGYERGLRDAGHEAERAEAAEGKLLSQAAEVERLRDLIQEVFALTDPSDDADKFLALSSALAESGWWKRAVAERQELQDARMNYRAILIARADKAEAEVERLNCEKAMEIGRAMDAEERAASLEGMLGNLITAIDAGSYLEGFVMQARAVLSATKEG